MATSTFISSSLASNNVLLWDKYGANAYLNGGVALTRKAAADANGRYCWSSGTLSRFTGSTKPKLYDPVYATAAATDQTVITSVTSVGAGDTPTGIYIGGDGLLLAPITRLGNVEMTTGGGIVSSGDDLSLDASSAWASGLSGIVYSRFVPLSKTSTGDPTPMTYELTSTMYGNMFTPNASAVVGSEGISAGYGTLLLNSYTVVDTIRANVPAGALTIPSEAAASIALANKQNIITVLNDSQTLSLDSTGNLSIGLATGVAMTSSAGWEYRVPSESAVRLAIKNASGSCIAYADTLYDMIINSGYATQLWVAENFASKGEGGGSSPIIGSYGPATYTSMGMVQPVLGGGLTVQALTAELSVASATETTFGGIRLGSNFYTEARSINDVVYSHCLTLSSATDSILGGITVPNNKGILLSSGAISLSPASTYANYTGASGGVYGGVKVVGSVTSTADSTYLNSGYVPSVQAVYNFVAGNYISNNLVFTSGLTSAGSTVTLDKAGSTSANLGGVWIPDNSGLALAANGQLTLSAATTTSIGGVSVPSGSGLAVNGGQLTLSSASYAASPVATTAEIGGVRIVSEGGLALNSGNVYVSGATITDTVATASANLTTSHLGGVVLVSSIEAAYTAALKSQPVAPTAPAVRAAINYSDLPFTIRTGLVGVDVKGGDIFDGTTYLKSWSGAAVGTTASATKSIYIKLTRSSASAAWSTATVAINTTGGTDSATERYFLIGTVVTDANNKVTAIRQVQVGNINLQKAEGGVNGAPVSGGTGIDVTASTNTAGDITSYTVTLSAATDASRGGVVVSTGINVNGGTIYVTGGTGIYTASNATNGHTLNLSSATTTSLGGVIVGSGLKVNAGTVSLAAETPPFTVTYPGSTIYQVTAGKVYNKNTGVLMASVSAGTLLVTSSDKIWVRVKADPNSTTGYTATLAITPDTFAEGEYWVPIATVTTINAADATIVQEQYGDIFLDTDTNTYTLTGATVVGTYSDANTLADNGNFGGVVLMSSVGAAPADSSGNAVAPTTDAVYRFASANYVSKTAYATTSTAGIVAIGDGIGISGTSKIYVKEAPYKGPFATTAGAVNAATHVVSKISISSGLVKWLDGYLEVGGAPTTEFTSSTQVANGGYVYLVGSSGYEESYGPSVTGATYTLFVSSGLSGSNYVAQTWSRASAGDASGFYAWFNASSHMAFTKDEYPTSDSVVYNGASIQYPDTDVIVKSSYAGITVGGTNYIYRPYDGSETGSASGGYEYRIYRGYGYDWVNGANSVTTLVQYPQPQHIYSSGISSSTIDADKTVVIGPVMRFDYANAGPSGVPPAGTFYTQIAKNSNGAIVQEQYGAVWHEHWGNDYRGQFAISRIPTVAGLSATYIPESDYAAYRYTVVNGGNVYGGLTFTGNLPDWMQRTSDGVYVAAYNIEYPTVTVSYKDGEGNTSTGKFNDGLYPAYQNSIQVWLNIWKGPWTTAYGAPNPNPVSNTEQDRWHFVVASSSFEGGENMPKNTYAVCLGWITGNGAPQQTQMGPIAIRGRWV